QLRGKSDIAGAVLLRVTGVAGGELKEKLAQTGTGRKVLIVKEDSSGVTARVFPKSKAMNG
ncbi:MAG: ABC transporter ATP-binding protein, partial [Limisphaerales bacterium]